MPERYSIPGEDLDFITQTAHDDLRSFENADFFLTGCTGFLGKWLMEGLLWANERMDLGLRLAVLTRSAPRFLAQMPHLRARRGLRLVEGSVTELEPEAVHSTSHIIHGANLLNDGSKEWPLAHMRTAYEGTRNVLALARFHNCSSMLLLSSGAVYRPGPGEGGPPFAEKEDGPQDYLNEPNVYANSKYFAEMLCAAYGGLHGIRIPVARCFTFMGAHMPLLERLALNSFLNDALHGRDIVVQGDGSAIRSYMYAADMVVWLLAILARGKHAAAYNVGSDAPLSIADAAQAVIGISDHHINIQILDKQTIGNAPSCYLPDINKSSGYMKLKCKNLFHDDLKRTFTSIKNIK